MENILRRQSVTGPALGILLSGLLSFGVSGVASAAEAGVTAHPSGCHYQIPSGNWGAVATCSSANGGSYRAIVLCKDTDTGAIRDYYGGWRQVGYSYAYCSGSSNPVTPGVETRP
jgi:hypothetical protein